MTNVYNQTPTEKSFQMVKVKSMIAQIKSSNLEVKQDSRFSNANIHIFFTLEIEKSRAGQVGAELDKAQPSWS